MFVCLSVFTPERKYAIFFWVIRNVVLGSMWDCVCGSINYVSKLDVCDPVLFVRVFLCAGLCSIFHTRSSYTPVRLHIAFL